MTSFPVEIKDYRGYFVVIFELVSSNSFRDIPEYDFATAAEAAADIDDSIKRKRELRQ